MRNIAFILSDVTPNYQPVSMPVRAVVSPPLFKKRRGAQRRNMALPGRQEKCGRLG
jgi:hypothetical protein